MITTLTIATILSVSPLNKEELSKISVTVAYDACRLELIGQLHKANPQITLDQVREVLASEEIKPEMKKCVQSVSKDVYKRIVETLVGKEI